jgi:hypothetical protein
MTPEKRLNQLEPIVADIATLANLTVEVRRGFDQVNGRLSTIEGDVSILKSDVSEIKRTQHVILKLLQERLS